MTVAETRAVHAALADAERDVLAVVMSAGRIPVSARELRAGDFGSHKWRAVWTAICSLNDRGESTDAASVAVELDRRDNDEGVRVGRHDLVTLIDQGAIPGALPTYVRHVQEAAERRRWEEAGQRLRQAATIGDLEIARERAGTVADLLNKTARSSAARPIVGLDLSRLDAPPVEPDWLAAHRIARGWLVLMGAKPGIGKSWLGIDLARAGATGRQWLGCAIPTPFRTLVVDAENGDDLALERLRQLGATSRDLGDRLHYVTEALSLPNPENVARLRATIEMHKPDLVIIDTLASAAPTAERDTESAAEFYSAVWHMIRDHGAALLLLVHLRKSLQGAGRDDPLDAFRGAGHLVGAAHRAWTLEPIMADKPAFLLHDVKARRGRKLPTIRVEVVDDPDSDPLRTTVDVVGTVAEVEHGYDQYIATVLAYLDATATGQGRAGDLLLLPDAPARRTANDYLTRAIATGVLHKPKRGVYTRGGAQLPDNAQPEEPA